MRRCITRGGGTWYPDPKRMTCGRTSSPTSSFAWPTAAREHQDFRASRIVELQNCGNAESWYRGIVESRNRGIAGLRDCGIAGLWYFEVVQFRVYVFPETGFLLSFGCQDSQTALLLLAVLLRGLVQRGASQVGPHPRGRSVPQPVHQPGTQSSGEPLFPPTPHVTCHPITGGKRQL